MPSIYQIKPRFQAVLRPAVGGLARCGVTANQITLLACAVSVTLGCGVYGAGSSTAGLLAIAVWMLLRMGLNAVDGMLAREHGQASRLGALLNELTDVISDAALYLPLAAITPLQPLWVAVFIVLAGVSEFAGALGPVVGASRRYDGPMGKSDRAFVVGLLCLWAAAAPLPPWMSAAMPLLSAQVAWTTLNRIRMALAETGARP